MFNKNFLKCLIAIIALFSVNNVFAVSKDVVVTKNGNVTNFQHTKDPFYLGQQYLKMPPQKRAAFRDKALKNPQTTLPIYYIYFAEDIYPQDKDTAAFLFMYGYYLSVQDVSMCTDKSAMGVLQGLGYVAPNSAIYVSKLSKSKMAEMKMRVFSKEETLTQRPNPKWICYHGMEAFSGEVKTLPMSEYDRVKKQVKAEFKKNK